MQTESLFTKNASFSISLAVDTGRPFSFPAGEASLLNVCELSFLARWWRLLFHLLFFFFVFFFLSPTLFNKSLQLFNIVKQGVRCAHARQTKVGHDTLFCCFFLAPNNPLRLIYGHIRNFFKIQGVRLIIRSVL